ncbi:MAG: hypothetical protein WC565_04810 [Parcubacteria group bacterium]
MRLTPKQAQALNIVYGASNRPITASMFATRMWRDTPKKRLNLCGGSYLSKLWKLGLLDRIMESWDDCPRYQVSELGLASLREALEEK